MNSRIITIIFAISFTGLFSQVAITYFPFQSFLGISSNTEKLLWADYKIETNSFSSNMNMELSPKINFLRKEAVNYYLGPGISFNPAYGFTDLGIMNGYFLDFGVRVKPWEQHRNFQVVFEISPFVNHEFKSGSLRTRLGLAWNFKKNPNNKK